jgi:hypothetical protein
LFPAQDVGAQILKEFDAERNGSDLDGFVEVMKGHLHDALTLAQWHTDPGNLKKCVEFVEHVVLIVEGQHFLVGIRDSQVDLKGEPGVADMRIAFASLFHQDAPWGLAEMMLRICFAEPKKQFEALHLVLKAYVDCEVSALLQELDTAVDDCNACISALEPDSAPEVAGSLKKSHDKMVSLLGKAKNLFDSWGLAVDEFKQFADADAAITLATRKSVFWGLKTLMTRKAVLQPEKGKETRDSIRSLHRMRVEARLD